MAELVLLQPSIGVWDSLKSNPSLPLGLMHAASLAAREFDTVLIDQRIDSNWKASLRKAIDSKTLAVGFTAFTGPMITSSLEMADEVRSITRLPHIWGGVHVSLVPETTITDDRVDIIVIGEGEQTLLELMRALKSSKSLENIAGIWYKENGEVKKTADKPLLDLDTLSEVPYELVNVQNYLPLYNNRKSLNFQSGRGCPHKCAYCYNINFNHRSFRKQSTEKILGRIRYAVEKFGVEDVFFLDDNFFVNPAKDKHLIDGMKEIGVSWQMQGVDILALKHMDDSIYKRLEQSGLVRLTIGIESGNPRIRKLIQKSGTVEDIESVIRRLVDYDIKVFAGYMVGFPTETVDEIKDTVNLLIRLLDLNPNHHNWPIYNYKPYPGTPLVELAVQHGYKLPTKFSDWGIATSWDHCNWRSDKEAKMLEDLHFVSNFLDRKTHIYATPLIVRLLSDIYRPVARYRVRNMNFTALLERTLGEKAMQIMMDKLAQSAKSLG